MNQFYDIIETNTYILYQIISKIYILLKISFENSIYKLNPLLAGNRKIRPYIKCHM